MTEPPDPAALLAALEQRLAARIQGCEDQLRLLAATQRNVLELITRIAGKRMQDPPGAG